MDVIDHCEEHKMADMLISEVLDSLVVNTQHGSSPCDIPYPEGGGGHMADFHGMSEDIDTELPLSSLIYYSTGDTSSNGEGMKMNYAEHDRVPQSSSSSSMTSSDPGNISSKNINEPSNIFQLGSPHHPVGETLLRVNAGSAVPISPNSSNGLPMGHHPFQQRELPSSTSGFPEAESNAVSQKVERKGTNTEGRLCQICCDSASGFHYGVWSCEGCKAFFKRSLQASHIGPVDYICPATNTCKIDKHRRKSCQACRLRKCLNMGMSKGNYRKDKNGVRQPRQNRRKNATNNILPEQMTPIISPANTPPSNHVFDLKKLIKGEVTSARQNKNSMVENQVNFNPKNGFHKEPLNPKMRQATTVIPPSVNTQMQPPMHPMVEHLLQIDPPIRMTGHDNQQPDTELNLVTSIIKLADLELIDIINWAKAINGYADLNLKDRVHLLEMCWTEVIVCGLVWRSMPISEHDTLVFAPDLHFNRLEIVEFTSLM